MATVFQVLEGVRAVRLRHHGIDTTADVIGVNTYRVGAGLGSRTRVVRFDTAEGEMATAELPSGQLRRLPVGARAGIRYLPERPSFARSAGGGFRYVFNLVGIAFFIFAGTMCLLS